MQLVGRMAIFRRKTTGTRADSLLGRVAEFAGRTVSLTWPSALKYRTAQQSLHRSEVRCGSREIFRVYAPAFCLVPSWKYPEFHCWAVCRTDRPETTTWSKTVRVVCRWAKVAGGCLTAASIRSNGCVRTCRHTRACWFRPLIPLFAAKCGQNSPWRYPAPHPYPARRRTRCRWDVYCFRKRIFRNPRDWI